MFVSLAISQIQIFHESNHIKCEFSFNVKVRVIVFLMSVFAYALYFYMQKPSSTTYVSFDDVHTMNIRNALDREESSAYPS